MEQITDNKPVCGETLLRSGKLKKKLQDARAWSHRQAQKSQPPASPPRGRSLRILVVEDHADTLRVLARLLIISVTRFQSPMARTAHWRLWSRRSSMLS